MDNLTSQNFLNTLLHTLKAKTLAYLVRDLEDYQEDWRYYPEEAPPPHIQQELRQILEQLKAAAPERATAEGLDFAKLLQNAIDEQGQEEWPDQRNQQVRKNWLSDLE
jgi:hypothetical protein